MIRRGPLSLNPLTTRDEYARANEEEEAAWERRAIAERADYEAMNDFEDCQYAAPIGVVGLVDHYEPMDDAAARMQGERDSNEEFHDRYQGTLDD